MLNKGYLIQPRRTYARYAAALGISLLLHVLLLGGVHLHLPDFNVKRSDLQVEILPPPLPKPQPPVVKPAVKKPKVSKPPSKAKAMPPPKAPPPAPPQEDALPVPPPAETPAPEPPASAPEPVAENAVPEEVAEPEPPPVPHINYVEMEYEVKNGKEGSVLGISHVSYKAQEGNRYTLTSETEAKGLASLFLSGKLRQVSEGEVTDQGLRPERFLYQYGKSDSKTRRAEFDWNSMTVKLKTAKGETSKPLVEDTQDLLSFMYQFMFEPPMSKMEIAVVNGKRISHYTYAFEGEETLNTSLGDIRTVHISKSSGDDEKTELWLATDYRNLPVKIRKTEEDGQVYEQVVTRLNTDIMK